MSIATKATPKLAKMKATIGKNVKESIGHRNGKAKPVPATNGKAKAKAKPDRWEGITRSQDAAEIPLPKLMPDPLQPRKYFDEMALDRLAASLKTRGQLQPIRVRWSEADAKYIIVCGERRFRAAQLAKLKTLTAIIENAERAEDVRLAEQLLENLGREDLSPIDQAHALQSLVKMGWSQRRIADDTSLSLSAVNRSLALLTLSRATTRLIEKGELPPSAGYEISRLPDGDQQDEMALRAVNESWGRDRVHIEVNNILKPASEPTPEAFHGETSEPTNELQAAGVWNLKEAIQRGMRRLPPDVGFKLFKSDTRTDAQILEALAKWPTFRITTSAPKQGYSWAIVGGDQPKLFFGNDCRHYPHGRGTLEGPILVEAIRKEYRLKRSDHEASRHGGSTLATDPVVEEGINQLKSIEGELRKDLPGQQVFVGFERGPDPERLGDTIEGLDEFSFPVAIGMVTLDCATITNKRTAIIAALEDALDQARAKYGPTPFGVLNRDGSIKYTVLAWSIDDAARMLPVRIPGDRGLDVSAYGEGEKLIFPIFDLTVPKDISTRMDFDPAPETDDEEGGEA